jgi:RNA polymerase sigma factor (sigma-70 family)
MYSELDEVGWMRRIVNKDPAALEQLYTKYERLIYSFAYRMVKDAMAAEEIVQELFMRIWKSAERYDPDNGKLSTWMFAITRNIAIDLIRKRKSRMPEPTAPEEQLETITTELGNTEKVAEQRWIGDEIRTALVDLNKEQQEVIELIYYQGYTQQDVSDLQAIPLGTVKSRVRLALRHLKGKLTHLGKEGIWG